MKSGPGFSSEIKPPDLSQTIFLIGFMGAGKSCVGQALSRRLNWRFEDLDERIVVREGRPIEQIFRESGEPGFRWVEHVALRELMFELDGSRAVVALGGGAFAQAENIALIAITGAKTVFLDGDTEELLRRCQGDGTKRPLLRDEGEFRRLYQSRRASYLGASLRIETGGKDVDTVVEELKRTLEATR
jgi:shikimate kinase